MPASALADATATTDTTATSTASSSRIAMHRLYNPNSGEHLYTGSAGERASLEAVGWMYEGVAWTAPASGNAVHRLYNPNGGDHHYTMSEGERNILILGGWVSEGVGWYSSTSSEVALYRSYNPNASVGAHNFTSSQNEHGVLVSLGWQDEGVAWYGVHNTTATRTPVMGTSKVSQAAMVNYYKANASYPSSVYAAKGAPTIEDFVRILCEVCESEGVRADVAFAQCCIETGMLSFGGLVQAEQCNFCGLGAGSDGGCVFADVRTGLLAQAQHLKAYASTEPLNTTCVDPRFDGVERGISPTVEALGDGGWATAEDYGYFIVEVMNDIALYE
ncbi:MAG: glucosaminidase domain-containing protein [Coriobacteriales bacterium]|nr:glucosaminidase domain-containing protein [Coriobacteriales bacterium]